MLYDSSTKRLILQSSGEIIFGPVKGHSLPIIPLRLVPWVTWETIHPESKVFFYTPIEKSFLACSRKIDKLKVTGFYKEKTLFRQPGKFILMDGSQAVD